MEAGIVGRTVHAYQHRPRASRTRLAELRLHLCAAAADEAGVDVARLAILRGDVLHPGIRLRVDNVRDYVRSRLGVSGKLPVVERNVPDAHLVVVRIRVVRSAEQRAAERERGILPYGRDGRAGSRAVVLDDFTSRDAAAHPAYPRSAIAVLLQHHRYVPLRVQRERSHRVVLVVNSREHGEVLINCAVLSPAHVNLEFAAIPVAEYALPHARLPQSGEDFDSRAVRIRGNQVRAKIDMAFVVGAVVGARSLHADRRVVGVEEHCAGIPDGRGGRRCARSGVVVIAVETPTVYEVGRRRNAVCIRRHGRQGAKCGARDCRSKRAVPYFCS